jgi:PhoPQ-activated pathogenicity-related protein
MTLLFNNSVNFCNAAEKTCYSNMNEVMRCFVNHQDRAYKYEIIDQQDDDNISIKTYILDSQIWPIKPDDEIPTTTWQHKLIVYTPKKVVSNKALLYIGGGYNINKDGEQEFSPIKDSLDFANIALSSNAPVVAVEDVPNQYLHINSIPKKEDQIIAFSYIKVMQNPQENAYLAGHLPMVKAIVKAMDASQEIFREDNLDISNFVLIGASKRGWATWLAGLEDERVSAMIPVAIDILNVQKNINHICNSYINYCPAALKDYKEVGITERINSDPFVQLMKIEDPFSYIDLPNYKNQAAIPKYIINNSGDDFYSPDSSRLYFDQLKGDSNYIRYFPKSMHYYAGNPISDYLNNIKLLNDAVSNYFYFHINNIALPVVDWQKSAEKISVNSSLKPEKVTLWTAQNSAERDFRFLNSYSQFHLGKK